MILRTALLLVCFRGAFSSTCNYRNPSTATTVIESTSNVVQLGSPGATETVQINEGESITVKCKGDYALQYAAQSSYTCPQGGSPDFTIPHYCVDKCKNLESLTVDSFTRFYTDDGTTVTGQALPSFTPVNIECTIPYYQKFSKNKKEKCEDWTDDDICKESCELTSYDEVTTRLDSTGLEVAGDKEYLRIGYTVSIQCFGSDLSLPDGAATTVACTEAAAPGPLAIASCSETCKVPIAPVDTVYHSSQTKLKEGQTFTVTCQGNKDLPFYTSKDTVECLGDGQFGPIPQCKDTCSITAVGDTTTVNKTVSGALAQDEAVLVQCTDPNNKLPFPFSTPHIIQCTEGGEKMFTIPACQQTCPVPAAPANGNLKRFPAGATSTLTLHEPVAAVCRDYYSYTNGKMEKNFTCTDTTGEAKVSIDDFCYVYAKLKRRSAGTYRVDLKGEINDGIDHSADNTKVKLTLTGDGIVHDVDTLPNEWQTVTLLKYEPLSVFVRTTSQISGEDKVISHRYDNIYPGPPAPLVIQQTSSSTEVNIELAKSSEITDAIFTNHFVKYIVSYVNKGEQISLENDLTGGAGMLLSNLDPASSYTISTKTVLGDGYGGEGSTQDFTIFTGPSKVVDAVHRIQQDVINITWTAVANAKEYDVTIQHDGDKFKSQTTSHNSVRMDGLEPDTVYQLNIVSVIEADVEGTKMDFYSDTVSSSVLSAPIGPSKDKFDVKLTGSKITVFRSSSNSVSKRSTDPDYVIFKNGEEHMFPATEEQLGISGLELSSSYDIRAAEAFGSDGYGMKTFLQNILTADCGDIDCVNCDEMASSNTDYITADTVVTLRCAENYTVAEKNSEGEPVNLSEYELTCNDKNQYVYRDEEGRSRIVEGPVECTKTGAVVNPPVGTDYTVYYIVGGVAVFLVLILIIILIALHRKRTQGSYNAKEAKEKSGVKSPTFGDSPRTLYSNDQAFFENKWDKDLRATGRSKTTSYGSQELRMEMADSDSGITEDLENVSYFNPALYSTHTDLEDTQSTKSALV